MLSPVIMMVVPILPSISQFVYSKLKTVRNFNENEVKSSRNTIEMERNLPLVRRGIQLGAESCHSLRRPHIMKS